MTESKQLRWHRIDVASFAAAKKTRFFNPRQKKLTLTLTQQQKEQHENLSLQLSLMCYCCGESRYRQAYNSVTYYTGPHLNLILSKLNQRLTKMITNRKLLLFYPHKLFIIILPFKKVARLSRIGHNCPIFVGQHECNSQETENLQ